jgi:hypothetical protein
MRALATRDTFSGITIGWPVEAMARRSRSSSRRLPVFDRERRFRGYRGLHLYSRSRSPQ